MKQTLIIGGGPAGMAAAVAAAQQGEQITLLERRAKPLKKLGATGNGRGNLLNSGPLRYFGDEAFAQQVLEHLPYGKLAAFWEGLGVPLRQEAEGRVYPAALQAAVAVEALSLRVQQLGVKVVPHTQALCLSSIKGGFLLEGEQTLPTAEPQGPCASPASVQKKRKPQPPAQPTPCHFEGSRVIVAAGGAAAPSQGTDGTAYGLLTTFGHTLRMPRPALCPLVTKEEPIQGLAGQRVRARLALRSAEGVLLAETQGEALFAADGVSGIAAMQLARHTKAGCTLHLDLREALNRERLSQEELAAYLRQAGQMRQGLSAWDLLTGLCVRPLARALLCAAGISGHEPIAQLGPAQYLALAGAIMHFSLPVLGTRGFAAAQVTAGGIATSDFDPATLESRLQPGLYAAGEVLDVDGDCGGFNLMFAVASGLLAGRG